jgi:gliding motility-associatede transport system auxiliary component
MLNRILGIVGWLGTGLVFAALAARVAGRFMVLSPRLDPYILWAAIAGFVCVLLYTAGQWREIARAFERRQTRLGAMALTGVVAFIGILTVVNVLAKDHSKRWDLTRNRIYSLSDQSVKILGSLDAPVKIMLFAQESDFPTYRDRLDEYAHASNRVTVEYVDADKKPTIAKQYQVESYGTTVFEYKGRVERVTSSTEQDLTNGLIKVLAGKEHTAYFTSGHGERDTASTERIGYSGIAAALQRDNFKVDKLVLAQQGDVPADATVVVVAGPSSDFFPAEIDALSRYINKGGKVLFLIDPPDKFDSPPLANLIALIRSWGVQLGDDVVVDVSGMGQILGTDASVPVAASYPAHPITERFSLLTAYPMARSVTPIPAEGGDRPTAQTFIETSARSWAETDVKQLTTSGQVAMEPAKGDKQGPISLGVALSAPVSGQMPPERDKPDEEPKPEIRLAVLGDSDFVANYTGNIRGNSDLFLNAVNWLAQQENLIAIRPKQPEDRRITMTAAQQRNVLWLSMFLLPGFIIMSGVYTWWRRR